MGALIGSAYVYDNSFSTTDRTAGARHFRHYVLGEPRD